MLRVSELGRASERRGFGSLRTTAGGVATCGVHLEKGGREGLRSGRRTQKLTAYHAQKINAPLPVLMRQFMAGRAPHSPCCFLVYKRLRKQLRSWFGVRKTGSPGRQR